MTSTASFAQAFADIGGIDGPDFGRLQEIVDKMVPFNNHVGIRIVEVGPDSGVAQIPPAPYVLNHLGTVHAGALYLAGEVAGAAAFCGAFATRLAGIEYFTLRDSRITFLKPANGLISARATVDPRTVTTILEGDVHGRFDLDGKALLHDENGVLVAKMYLDYVCATVR
jgi:acyl-coenzyme A thioesterase PaaI-like protein